MGQKPPGKTAEVFAPAVVSTDAMEVMFGFFNNDSLFFFERAESDFDKDWIHIPVYRTEMKNGVWTQPQECEITGEPWVHAYPDAPAGTEIIFPWTKELDGSGPPLDVDMWRVVKTSDGWLPPQRLGPPVNTDKFDSWPSLALDKTLYFFSNRDGGFGRSDLYRAEWRDGEYREVENLGKVINSEFHDHDPFTAPDGSYLLWCSDRSDGYGGNDLYIAYRNSDGQWTGPFNLGKNINTSANETRPYVTGNGRYLFFASDANGGLDIYWVDAGFIKELKPEELK
jgi:hypothetical protein